MRTVTWKDVAWQVEDVVIPAIPEWSFWDAWERGEFEPGTLDAIDRFVTSGSTFVDVGAWIGPTTLWAASRGAHVIAVEPDPAATRVLYQNTQANCPTVSIFHGAITPQSGRCHIEPHSDGWGSSMTHLAETGFGVPGITMQDLFDLYDIQDCSLVKMDIEGAESLVLEGCAPYLARRGVPLLVAMHQPWWKQPVQRSWFDEFSIIEGTIGGWEVVLAVP